MKTDIKYLAPYLPYGLKVDIRGSINTLTIQPNYVDNPNTHIHLSTVLAKPLLFKPILRPMSDLVKEIDFNGEMKVPLVELLLICKPSFKIELLSEIEYSKSGDVFTFVNFLHLHDVFRFIYHDKDGFSLWYYRKGSQVDIENNYLLWQKLFEMHFDVFGLIEKCLAININALEVC